MVYVVEWELHIPILNAWSVLLVEMKLLFFQWRLIPPTTIDGTRGGFFSRKYLCRSSRPEVFFFSAIYYMPKEWYLSTHKISACFTQLIRHDNSNSRKKNSRAFGTLFCAGSTNQNQAVKSHIPKLLELSLTQLPALFASHSVNCWLSQ